MYPLKMYRLKMRHLSLFILFSIALPSLSQASGNHPEAGACPKEAPHYAICTHSLHSLEGWYSRECRTTRQAAEKDAEAHARKFHNGNMRWTGVAKTR